MNRKGIITGALITFLFITWGIFYCFILPPFQGADEPSHFLGYASIRSDKKLSSEALVAANRFHFFRIKQKNNEKFASEDVNNPLACQWDETVSASEKTRSPLSTIIWKSSDIIFKSNCVEKQIIILRVTGLLFVGLALFISLSLTVYCEPKKNLSLMLGLVFLCVPSIIYNSAVLSNYSYLIGSYILQSFALYNIVNSERCTVLNKYLISIGILSGLGLSMGILAGDNGVIASAVWAILLPVYLMCVSQKIAISLRVSHQRLFIKAFTLSMLLPFLFTAVYNYSEPIVPVKVHELLIKNFHFYSNIIPFILIPLVAIIIYSITRVLDEIIIYLKQNWLITSQPTKQLISIFIVLLIIIGSYKYSVYDIECVNMPVDSITYSISVLTSFLSGFFSYNGDHLVCNSFWGNYGWLDTPLPYLFIIFVKEAFGLGLILGMAAYFYKKEVNYSTLYIFLFLAICLFTLAIGLSYYRVKYNVHGRYLFGPYLFIIALSTCGYIRSAGTWKLLKSKTVVTILLVLSTILNTISINTILNRYF